MNVSSSANLAEASALGSSSLSERLATIGKFIVDTPTLTQSVQFIRQCLDSHGCSSEGEISFLLGESRAGKTTAIETLMLELAQEIDGKFVSQRREPEGRAAGLMSVDKITRDGVHRPVLAIGVPKAPTFKGLLADVLAALGINLKSRATFVEQQSTICKQLRGQQTKLLIFDEAQHISESGKNKEVYAAADVFKILAKISGVQILCVGLPHALDIKLANPQVRWIGGIERTILPLAVSARPGSDLAILCTTFNAELPFNAPSQLCDPDVFVPLAIYCGGYEGRIATIVRLAARHAIRTNRNSLGKDCFAEFLREMRGVPDNLNPFLLQVGELDDLPKRMEEARKAEEREVAARLGSGARNGRAFAGAFG